MFRQCDTVTCTIVTLPLNTVSKVPFDSDVGLTFSILYRVTEALIVVALLRQQVVASRVSEPVCFGAAPAP